MSTVDAGPAEPKRDRPQTSTRDLEDVRERLERWLATKLPDGAAPSVGEISAPAANGMSSETLLFDATWNEDGGAVAHELVARVAPDPTNTPVFPSYDMERQFRVMQVVGELGVVPIPRVHWCETDAAAIGSPFFVMSRVEGEVPPDVLPYNFGESWLYDAKPEDQRRLQDSSVAVIAALHAIPEAERTFSFLASTRPEPTPLGRHVGEQRDYYTWVADGLRSPLIERAFVWLEEHWPAEESPTALSWGDSRIGNMMFRDFEPVAVLDWEMAALGPPEIDLAWCIFLHRFFEDLATGYGFPGMPDFMRRDDVAATYERLSGHEPQDLDFYTLYAALRHAIVMTRVQRRAIHFGEATMPDDVDDLIMHRATLEAMVAGTYWT